VDAGEVTKEFTDVKVVEGHRLTEEVAGRREGHTERRRGGDRGQEPREMVTEKAIETAVVGGHRECHREGQHPGSRGCQATALVRSWSCCVVIVVCCVL